MANDGDAELEGRRRELGDKLKSARLQEELPEAKIGKDAAGLGQIMRLSSEFVAGVITGGALGWGIDHIAGSKPWGLIVFTLLGFAAGVLNMMRVAGLIFQPGLGKRK